MSMFSAEIICNPDFIKQVESDSIDHWRMGRYKFLTGDDKSTWFWVLKNRYRMLYVPDTKILTVEHPPAKNFFKASSLLMFRWFGNMLRTNGRALKLGPWRIGLFTWWCVLDQRISMWTSLTGPVFALMFTFKYSPVFLLTYFVWIGFTRWIMALMLLAARPVLSWRYPFLLYYNQIWGSLIKTYVFFRLDRQSWTRQKTKLRRNLSPAQQLYINFSSVMMHGVAITCFVALVGLAAGVFTIPELY
jgi:glycosyltransferase Alg8